MANRLRVVLDTNLIVSAALFSDSLPRAAFDYARFNADLLMSLDTCEELEAVLLRPKFDRYVGRPSRRALLDDLPSVVTWINVSSVVTMCRHEKDNKFLELAVDGKADFLVTGDRDLLDVATALTPEWKFRITTPAEFLLQIEQTDQP